MGSIALGGTTPIPPTRPRPAEPAPAQSAAGDNLRQPEVPTAPPREPTTTSAGPLTLDELIGTSTEDAGDTPAVARNLLSEAQADLRAHPEHRTVEDDPATIEDESETSANPGADAAAALDGELSQEDQATVRELQARDREVRAHELAHAAAGGALAGSPSYVFELGPDGRRYAVGGDVQIKTGGGGTPEERIQQAAQVRAAALAPASPSGQDLAVAAAAAADAAQARADARYAAASTIMNEPSSTSLFA